MIEDKNAHKEKIKIVASVLIRNEKGKILAITVKDTDGKKINIAPGGRVEVKETARECAIREVKEEVGVDIKIDCIEGILEKEYSDGFWTFILYRGRIVDGSVKNMEEDEITNLRWVDITMLDNYENIMWVAE